MAARIFALCLLIPLPALWAQGGAGVALVNVEQVLAEALPVRAALDSVDAEVAARQRELAQREEALREMTQTYRAQASLWSEEVRSQQQREIIEESLELEELESGLRSFLDAREADVIRPIFERITEAIRQVAEEKGIDLVLRSDAAVYSAQSLNLTEEVIERINESDLGDIDLPPQESDE